jgi:hypothetical protein
MNERVRELARRVVGKNKNDVGSISLFDEQIEQFAELIVRECARIVPNTDLEDVDGGDSAVLRAASDQIKEHFGVK